MPKHFRARITTTRRKRHLLMAAIVFTMSPVLANPNASADGVIARPPLPLTGTAGQQVSGDSVKVNPFCMPARVTQATPIMLASGTDQTNVRLQPIGEAIGLQNIGQGPVEQSDTPAITVEAPAESPVHSNPMTGQSSHGMELEAATSAEVDQVGPAQQQSSIVLLPMKRAVVAAAQPAQLMDPVVEPVVIDEPITEQQEVMLQPELVQPEIGSVADQPADDMVSEPICFSMSDDSESELGLGSANGEPVESEFESALGRGTDHTPSDIGYPSDDAGLASDESEEVQPLALAEMAEAKPIEATLMDGAGGPQTNHFVTESNPIAGDVITGPEPTLHSRRYRPPVAVQAVPVAMERQMQEETLSQIDSVVVSAPSLSREANVSKQVVTPLYINRAQVRSLTLGAELHSVKIGDKSVCQAFAAGPNQIKLIGTGNGTTRLVVYAKPSQGDSQPRARAFDVHVKDSVEATGAPTMDRPDMLNQTIQQTFPNADVFVKKNGNELVVMGRCGSEAVAKKIVRLVRRTCLVPVKDELRVR